jgi:ABC-type protease/lipase transport system fused ATPase/permease subunit
MTNAHENIDTWSSFVATLAQQVLPTITATDVYDRLGVAGLFVMSEEWWDPSVIDMHPRMPVGVVPALNTFRRQQLQRITTLGVTIDSTWYRVDDQVLLQSITYAINAGQVVGLLGMSGHGPMHVLAVDGSQLRCSDSAEIESTIDLRNIRAPAGVECMVCTQKTSTSWHPIDDINWLCDLLQGVSTIAFDTPRHPLRDWQVWHIGVDAFAVAAFAAETAAPLAIVSDNVARITHAYAWRIGWLQQQLMRINQSIAAAPVQEAIDACADARFFVQIVTHQYGLSVERRALSLAEGALIAEACRDTRQALRSVVALLNGIR